MRVLFVVKQITLYEPLGMLYLSSTLKRKGVEVEVAVCDEEDPVQKAKDFRPDVLAYSTWTGRHPYYLELNRRIRREVDAFSVFGGPHPTFFPDLIDEEFVDGVCVGEGETAFSELVDHFGNDRTKARGWVFKNGASGPVRTETPPPIADLDTIPFPDRDILYKRNPYLRDRKLKYMFAGRGCPYTCTYCFNHAFNKIYKGLGKVTRKRSLDNLFAEIDAMRRAYPLEMILFYDDVFVIDKGWLEEFAPRYRREVGLPFICEVMPNTVTEDVGRWLKEAGCISAFMGIETANDHLLKVMERRTTRARIVEAADILKKNGIRINALNMIGLPGETRDDAFETIELNRRCNVDFAWVAIFQPYPGTKLAQYCKDNGYFDGDVDKISYTYHDSTVLKLEHFTAREVDNLHKLFGLAVELGIPRSTLERLIRLPAGKLYRFLYTVWYGYAIKSRISPYRTSAREFAQTVRRFFVKDRG
ncbi:MAG: B12-binding domain-containing radical SAM protein [Planctomycetes bacterium]|nr:B12-binding domain-containing radical SAM protein [Planctomycetota bacterium]MBI3843175.1 B12-binding domain-containing radical SAM protein [Planctomycetota bacterium]